MNLGESRKGIEVTKLKGNTFRGNQFPTGSNVVNSRCGYGLTEQARYYTNVVASTDTTETIEMDGGFTEDRPYFTCTAELQREPFLPAQLSRESDDCGTLSLTI